MVQRERKTATILAIGAHPDDIEVGCGGTLQVLTELGYEVHGIILTDGERGGNGKERVQEALISGRTLGLKNVFFEHLEDGKLYFDADTVNIIEEYIKKLQPQKVFSHSRQDRHQDHWNCARITQAAARKGVNDILMYEIYGSALSSFTPHYITDISETINSKLASIKAHQSQVKKGTLNLEGLREHAGSVGKEYGYRYGEAFEINHLLFNRERFAAELILAQTT